MTWQEWLDAHWDDLAAGKVITLYRSGPGPELPSACDGWTEVFIAEPFGQSRDWAFSLSDGSRLHAHEYRSHFAIHRDIHDPGRGFGKAVRHYLEEAPSSRLVVTGALGLLALKAAKRLLLPALALALASCERPPSAAEMGPSPECEARYVMMIAAWSIDLSDACKPIKVEDCGAPRDKVNVLWNPRFDAWERECQ